MCFGSESISLIKEINYLMVLLLINSKITLINIRIYQ